MIPPAYTIEPASRAHLAALPAIEHAAAQLFVGLGVADAVLDDESSQHEFEEAQREGMLWVALAPDGEPVGFALADVLESGAHLEEIDVHPNHGRQGLGAALVRRVCEWAAAAGFARVTLTTFRDIPWNAPFYAGLGFRELPASRFDDELAELVREESERGLAPEQRVVMCFEIRAS